MPTDKISLDKAKHDKLFYFVANAVVFRASDRRCLILKRSDSEKVHPGKYCVPGGKMEWNDIDLTKPTRINGEVLDFENAIEDLLAREVREEAGIVIGRELKYVNSVVYVRPDGIPTVLVKFAAVYQSDEVKTEAESFSGSVWVNADEVKKYDCISGVPEEILKTIALFND
jgi:8-oxo-dGTP pyrophosphatase MutT (NUDIX family)